MAHLEIILRRIRKISKLNFKYSIYNHFHNSSSKLSSCSNEDSKTQIFHKISNPIADSRNKVSIIGIGQVGIAVAVGLIVQKITSHVALYDSDEKLIQGEVLDLEHGSCFLNNPKIEGSTNLDVTKNSRVCVLTLGKAPEDQKTDMCALAKQNADTIKSIVPLIFKHSPDTILLVITSPVEAITYACAKLASNIPKHKIIGTGCNLDSTRLRFFMSQKYQVGGESCKGWVIGENGASSVVLWSTLTVGGVRLCLVNTMIGSTCDPENWKDVHQQVIMADFALFKMKGNVSWAVAADVVEMIDSILNNTRKVFSVSVSAKGCYGICQDVYCSLPCVLGEDGISEILTIPITNSEHENLIQSACIIEKMQASTCIK